MGGLARFILGLLTVAAVGAGTGLLTYGSGMGGLTGVDPELRVLLTSIGAGLLAAGAAVLFLLMLSVPSRRDQ